MSGYARGGFIEGPSSDIPVLLSPCEAVVHPDGRITRHGVTVGQVDMEKMRERLERLNEGEQP